MAVKQFQERVLEFLRGWFGLIVAITDREGAGRNQQCWKGPGTAGQESDKPCHLGSLVDGVGGKLYTHTESRVHHSYRAFRLDFHILRFQAEGNSGAFWKRRLGFDVTPAQAEIGQSGLRYRFWIGRQSLRRVRGYPGFQRGTKAA